MSRSYDAFIEDQLSPDATFYHEGSMYRKPHRIDGDAEFIEKYGREVYEQKLKEWQQWEEKHNKNQHE